eukprot:2564255-Rhodomonas_salina.1
MSVTGLFVSGLTGSFPLSSYAHAMRCPVLMFPIFLRTHALRNDRYSRFLSSYAHPTRCPVLTYALPPLGGMGTYILVWTMAYDVVHVYG